MIEFDILLTYTLPKREYFFFYPKVKKKVQKKKSKINSKCFQIMFSRFVTTFLSVPSNYILMYKQDLKCQCRDFNYIEILMKILMFHKDFSTNIIKDKTNI